MQSTEAARHDFARGTHLALIPASSEGVIDVIAYQRPMLPCFSSHEVGMREVVTRTRQQKALVHSGVI